MQETAMSCVLIVSSLQNRCIRHHGDKQVKSPFSRVYKTTKSSLYKIYFLSDEPNWSFIVSIGFLRTLVLGSCNFSRDLSSVHRCVYLSFVWKSISLRRHDVCNWPLVKLLIWISCHQYPKFTFECHESYSNVLNVNLLLLFLLKWIREIREIVGIED